MSTPEWFKDLSKQEQAKLREHVVRGSEIDLTPKIPNAPDLSEAPKERLKEEPEPVTGLVELKVNEEPVIGKHFVVWGSNFLQDIRERPVRRTAPVTEAEYVGGEVAHTKRLLEYKLKNPMYKRQDRVARTRAYAGWRYRGYVAGEIVSL